MTTCVLEFVELAGQDLEAWHASDGGWCRSVLW